MRQDSIITGKQHYRTGNIELHELINAITKHKGKTAPGPDEVPIECFKEMEQDTLHDVQS